jgi:uridine phosphorylase
MESPHNKMPHKPSGPFSPSDLIMSPEGRIYHLALTRDQISNNILIVGDPERVPMIAEEHLHSISHRISHRGLNTITGKTKGSGQRISITTSGMGTPSLEIVLSELMALNEIDPQTRCRIADFKPIRLIRVGTSGILQSDILPGRSIITTHAIGLDNTGLFYEVPPPDGTCTQIERAVQEMLEAVMSPSSRFYGKIHPYVSKADQMVVDALCASAKQFNLPFDVGITATASGFNANQGRDVSRIAPSVPDIDLHLSRLEFSEHGRRVLNMEMESSHLFHFAAGHGYQAGTVCAGLANRRHDTFPVNTHELVLNAAKIALGAFEMLEANEASNLNIAGDIRAKGP